jgi:urease accessory protein
MNSNKTSECAETGRAPKRRKKRSARRRGRAKRFDCITTMHRVQSFSKSITHLDLTLTAPIETAADSHWPASLRLRFAYEGARTILAERSHRGPLRLLKPLYPEGDRCCHAVIVHPPGGIVAGDTLDVNVAVDADAHGLVTTPGAQKWYRSLGSDAHANTKLRLADNAMLEWMPQETIVFDGAFARQSLDIRVSDDARFFGWEVVCFGRTASQEQFRNGSFRQTIRLHRNGLPIWIEHSVVAGGDPLLQSPLGWGGMPVSATAWLVRTARAGDATDAGMLNTLRDVLADREHAAASNPADGLFVIKAVGESAESVRELLTELWSEVRFAVFGIEPQRPRIWST